jgi:hypothetical protein
MISRATGGTIQGGGSLGAAPLPHGGPMPVRRPASPKYPAGNLPTPLRGRGSGDPWLPEAAGHSSPPSYLSRPS